VKGRAALSRRGAAFVTRDLFKQPLGVDEIRRLAKLARGGLRGLLSTRSTQVKALGLDRPGVSDAQILQAMAKEPRLIRRPLLVDGRTLVIGFDREAYERIR
jgi:arsenate reductase-like glutaredoxin family protein